MTADEARHCSDIHFDVRCLSVLHEAKEQIRKATRYGLYSTEVEIENTSAALGTWLVNELSCLGYHIEAEPIQVYGRQCCNFVVSWEKEKNK